jgi:hypothetical protein
MAAMKRKRQEEEEEEAEEEKTTFESLPQELQLHVLSFLKAKELSRVAFVCRRWRGLATSDSLWLRRFKVEEPFTYYQTTDRVGELSPQQLIERWSRLRQKPKVLLDNAFSFLISLLKTDFDVSYLWPDIDQGSDWVLRTTLGHNSLKHEFNVIFNLESSEYNHLIFHVSMKDNERIWHQGHLNLFHHTRGSDEVQMVLFSFMFVLENRLSTAENVS